MLIMMGLLLFLVVVVGLVRCDRISHSRVPNIPRVCGVRGRDMMRMSRSWARKVWRSGFVGPEYQAKGRVPSGSPRVGRW